MTTQTLRLFADGTEFAVTNRKRLSREFSASLSPNLSALRLYALSDSDKSLLLSSARLRVLGESDSLLAEGKILSVVADASDENITQVLFSDTADLSRCRVSLTIPSGTTVLDSIRTICEASTPKIPFTAPAVPPQNPTVSRPQTCHGLATEAIRPLAAAANLLPFFSNGALCLAPSTAPPVPDLILTSEDLTGPIIREPNRLHIRTHLKSFPFCAFVEIRAPEGVLRGRVLSTHIEADTFEGPMEQILALSTENRIREVNV